MIFTTNTSKMIAWHRFLSGSQWEPEGHRRGGCPRMTWRPTVEAEGTDMGHSWGTLRTLAQRRLRWRNFVTALDVYDTKGGK